MLIPEDYLCVTTQTQPPLDRGGQQLILAEVLALLYPFKRVWIPFPIGCRELLNHLHTGPWSTIHSGFTDWQSSSAATPRPPECDAFYFGTPTIVKDTPLFPETADKIINKKLEREVVTYLCSDDILERTGARRIVCGLGSGDISVEERLADVGKGAKVVVMKEFNDFTDWVIAREIK